MTFFKKIKKFFGKLENSEDDLYFFGKRMHLKEAVDPTDVF